MKQKTQHNVKKGIANFFGSFGYLLCSLQWLWVVMLYFSVVKSMVLLISSNADKQVGHPTNITFAPPGSSKMIILGVVVAIMVAITIYALVKIPMTIVKSGNKIVHKSAETMAPIVIKTQHKKDTKKNHSKVTAKLILGIKLLLVVIPVVLTAASGLLEKQPLDYSIAMVVGVGLACFSVAFFGVQYALAALFRVKLSDLW